MWMFIFVTIGILTHQEALFAHEEMYTDCRMLELMDAKSTSSMLERDGDRIVVEEYFFDDSNCQNKIWEKTWAADLTFGRVLNQIGDREVDMLYLGVFIKPTTAQSAQMLQKNRFCGRESWLTGEYHDVAGEKCDAIVVEPLKDQIIYSMMRPLEHEFVLGKRTCEFTGQSTATRVRELDWTMHFKEKSDFQ